jgi:hypothetical protein
VPLAALAEILAVPSSIELASATATGALFAPLMVIVSVAVASIVVTRRGLAVDWAPALERSSAVAIALR